MDNAFFIKNPLCKGVTFSGGEPFAQAEGFGKLARMLKAYGYEVASYTGYTFEQLLQGTAAQKKLLSANDKTCKNSCIYWVFGVFCGIIISSKVMRN